MQLQRLNASQLKAVKATEGQVLVLAGAGSGKTRVLTYRIAYLIDLGVKASNIIALTFTNKAAKEMKSRVIDLVGLEADDVWMGTFHSICVKILRRHASALDYTSNFVIYDAGDQRELIKKIMKELAINDKELKINYIKAAISKAKNQRKTPVDYQKNTISYQTKQIAEIYKRYQRALKNSNAMDFDDLLVNTLNLFEKDKEVLKFYQNKFRYLHVDEYQDTNHVQYLLVKKLAAGSKNLCVVGDGDQSIYSWRGADIRNIRDFTRDYKDAKLIMLEQNYRSSQKILDAANAVIGNNSERHDKNLWTDNNAGEDIVYYQAPDAEQEADFVAQEILDLSKDGIKLSNFAVLYRTNAQSRLFENAFNRAGIAYKIIGGHKFYERAEIKDMLAYLRFIANPLDDVSFLRIINQPRRGIGAKTLERLMTIANDQNIALYQALEYALNESAMGAKTLRGLRDFYILVHPLIEDIEQLNGSEILKRVFTNTSYKHNLELEKNPQAQARIENIDELYNQMIDFEQKYMSGDLNLFLQEIALYSDQDEIEISEQGEVLLMTLHAAKGLEFDTVFLVGMEETLFPSAMAVKEGNLDEERRLCYVGITRAERRLYLSSAQRRMYFGSYTSNAASRFIDELPDELLERRFNKQINNTKLFFESSMPAKNENSVLELKAGTKVKHAKFGKGMVITVKDKNIVTIAFDKSGIKHLDKTIAPLEIVD